MTLLELARKACGEHVTEVIDKTRCCTLCSADLSGIPIADRLTVYGGNTTVIAGGMCETCMTRFDEDHPGDVKWEGGAA